MSGTFDLRRIELLEPAAVEAMKRLGGTERLRMMGKLTTSGRKLMEARVRQQHPDWSAEAVSAEVARRLSHGAP